jgi:hypothetical protein
LVNGRVSCPVALVVNASIPKSMTEIWQTGKGFIWIPS